MTEQGVARPAGDSAGDRGQCWGQGSVLGSGVSAGVRGQCWGQGSVLGSGDSAGDRGQCWGQGSVLGSGVSAGVRGQCWGQGSVLGSGVSVGAAQRSEGEWRVEHVSTHCGDVFPGCCWSCSAFVRLLYLTGGRCCQWNTVHIDRWSLLSVEHGSY